MTQIEKFEAIEGKASDVRQSRTTIISSGGVCDHTYECLFRLSDTPVALRVSSPIFIEDGETVKVVGMHNWYGVFDALAYHNFSTGASGNSDRALAQTLYDQLVAIICILGMTLAIVGLFTSSFFIHKVADLLFVVCAFFGLLLAIGLAIFLRYRSEVHTIARLLDDS